MKAKLKVTLMEIKQLPEEAPSEDTQPMKTQDLVTFEGPRPPAVTDFITRLKVETY